MGTWTRRLVLAISMLAASGLAVAAPARLAGMDDAIVDLVRMKLASDPVVKGVPIEVKAVDGIVTLAGCVASATVSRRAAQVARKASGVKAVTNNLAPGRC
jgi:osmotically-inducible protein OsmY